MYVHPQRSQAFTLRRDDHSRSTGRGRSSTSGAGCQERSVPSILPMTHQGARLRDLALGLAHDSSAAYRRRPSQPKHQDGGHDAHLSGHLEFCQRYIGCTRP